MIDLINANALSIPLPAGRGTTGLVARQLGRRFVGLDISLDYLVNQARPRLALDKLDAWTNGSGQAAPDADYSGLPLFAEAT
jgi:hypothetical protein